MKVHRSSRWCGPTLVGLAITLGGLCGPAATPAQPPLRLQIEAPPELEATARRLRDLDPTVLAGITELTGLREPGPPIRVVLAPEDSEAARSAPAWVAGYAYGALGRVVLFPERTPSYPDSSLEELLRHELAHVLIARAAAGRPLPRWFNEGLATLAADAWRLGDRSRLTLALLLEGELPTAEMERLFAGDRGEVARAYALSSAFVRDLVLRHGARMPADLLSLVAIGHSFEHAFLRSTGRTVAQAERSFWRRYSIWYRWVPVLGSSLALWGAITLLFLLAAWVKRRRTAAIERRWEEEERWLEESGPSEPVN